MFKTNHLMTQLVLLAIVVFNISIAQEFNIYRPLQNKDLIHKISSSELLKYDQKHLLSKTYFKNEDSIITYHLNEYNWFFGKTSKNEIDNDHCYELFVFNTANKNISQITHRNFGFSTEFLLNLNDFNKKLFLVTIFNLNVDNSGEVGVLLIDQDNMTEGNYIPIRKSAWLEKINIHKGKILIEVQPFNVKYNFWSIFNFLTPKEKSPQWDYEKYGNRWEYILDSNFVIVDSSEIIIKSR